MPRNLNHSQIVRLNLSQRNVVRTISDVELVAGVKHLDFTALGDLLGWLVIHEKLGGALSAEPVHDQPLELLVLNRIFLQQRNSG